MKSNVWRKALKLIRKPDSTAVILGRTPDGSVLSLPWRVRNEHVHILGAPGSGKSTLLTQYMGQAVRKGEGLILLDPHGDAAGSPYRNLLPYATHTIDFSSNRVVGFNPLACPDDTDPSVIVGFNAAALSVAWEGERFSNSPTGERATKTILHTLVDLKLTYCETRHLIEPADHSLRQYAIQNVKDSETRDGLKRLDELATDRRRWRDFEQETVFTRNRIARLLDAPLVRAMLGQTMNTLDIRAIMDSGGVLLCNLSGGLNVPDATADMFGKVLTNSILFQARRRTHTAPINVVIDEAHRYFSTVIPSALAELRKFGVSMVMAMQWLDQADETIQPAILKGTGVKICFRLRDAEESERVARTLIPYRLERPVTALIRPTVVGHRRIKLANESESDQESWTTNQSVTNGTQSSIAVAEGEFEQESETETEGGSTGTQSTKQSSKTKGEYDGEESKFVSSTEGETAGASSQSSKSKGKTKGRTTSLVVTRQQGTSRAVTHGTGHTRGKGYTRGTGEALEPILENRPSAVHNQQNEQYAAGFLLRSLRTGVAYVNFVGADGPVATLVRVPPVAASKKLIAADESGIPLADALKLITERADIFDKPVEPKPKKPVIPKPTRDIKAGRGSTW